MVFLQGEKSWRVQGKKWQVSDELRFDRWAIRRDCEFFEGFEVMKQLSVIAALTSNPCTHLPRTVSGPCAGQPLWILYCGKGRAVPGT
jgi:hypothetical protein